MFSVHKLSPSPITLPSAVSAIRGGAVVDLERATLRIDAFDAYPVIAALLMGAMLDMNENTPKIIKNVPDDADKFTSWNVKIENAFTCLYALVNTLSIVFSAYGVVIFTLVVIYSKTALGMELDQSYLEFRDATADLRYMAFQSIYLSMTGFLASLSLSLYLKGEGIFRWIEFVPTFAISVLSVVHYKAILDIAGRLIFNKVQASTAFPFRRFLFSPGQRTMAPN